MDGRRYCVWVVGTYGREGWRPAVRGGDLDDLRDYAKQQRVACEIRTEKTGVVVWPKAEGEEDVGGA